MNVTSKNNKSRRSGRIAGARTLRREPESGRQLWSSSSGKFAIRRLRGKDGRAMYQGHDCGRIPGIPIMLIINRRYAVLERRLAGCLPSGDLQKQILPVFYRVFMRCGIRDDPEGQRVLLESGRRCWPAGHALFLEMARPGLSTGEPLWDKALTEQVFGDGYYTHSITWGDSLRLAYAAIESRWDAEGRLRLPDYFTVFGVIDAERRYDELRSIANREIRHGKRRRPTNREAQALRLLEHFISQLVPQMRVFFSRYRYRYRVIETNGLAGRFSRRPNTREVKIELSAGVFTEDLASALATFLHEHGRLFDNDGGRSFTDALTTMLEEVIRRREQLERYDVRWRILRENVLSERNALAASHINALARQLVSLREVELGALAARLPRDVRRILRHDGEPCEPER